MKITNEFLLVSIGVALGAALVLAGGTLLTAYQLPDGLGDIVGSVLGVFGAYAVAAWQFSAGENQRAIAENKKLADSASWYLAHLDITNQALIVLVEYQRGIRDGNVTDTNARNAYNLIAREIDLILSLPRPPEDFGPSITQSWTLMTRQLQYLLNIHSRVDDKYNAAQLLNKQQPAILSSHNSVSKVYESIADICREIGIDWPSHKARPSPVI